MATLEPLEQLARAALERDHLRLRSLVQDLTRAQTQWNALPRPQLSDPCLLALAASLAELLATRQQQTPPAWTNDIGPLKDPFFLL